MSDITGNPPLGTTTVQAGGHDQSVAPNQEPGVVAKGIGLFKKIWLHITGKVSDAHSKQLNNLRAQVGQRFDKKGLQDLDSILERRGWKGPGATKLMTTKEITSLIVDLEVRGRLEGREDTIRDKISSDPEFVMRNPKVLAVFETFARSKEETDDRQSLALMQAMQRFRDGDQGEKEFSDLVDFYTAWTRDVPEYSRLKLKPETLQGFFDGFKKAGEQGDTEKQMELAEVILAEIDRVEQECLSGMHYRATWHHNQGYEDVVRSMAVDELIGEGFEKQMRNLRLI